MDSDSTDRFSANGPSRLTDTPELEHSHSHAQAHTLVSFGLAGTQSICDDGPLWDKEKCRVLH